MPKSRKVPTKRQALAVAAYVEKGSYQEAAKLLGVKRQTAHELVQTAVGTLDLDNFQRQKNERFVTQTWRIIEKTEDILERKLDLLLDTDKLDKEDATKLSRVIYDLRRSMQGAVTFIQMNIARNAEANSTPIDIEAEAVLYFSDKYNKTPEQVRTLLDTLNQVDSASGTHSNTLSNPATA